MTKKGYPVEVSTMALTYDFFWNLQYLKKGASSAIHKQ